MLIRVEGGWSGNMDEDFFKGIFKGIFGILKAYLVVFCLFIPQTEEEKN